MQLRPRPWALRTLLLFVGLGGCGDDSGNADGEPLDTSGGTTEASSSGTDMPGTFGTGESGEASDTSEQDGCGPGPEGMVCVRAGPFIQGSTEGEEDEQPQRTVTLSAFWIDRLEVTASQYAACMDDGACVATMGHERCTVTALLLGEAELADHPASCISWLAARDYCTWAGKRLPTEAEWEKAARGEDGRTYPWGDEPPTCERAVMQEVEGEPGCGADGLWPVGSRPSGASPYGAMDMAGNVAEWVNDFYDWQYYEEAPDVDPPGPEASTFPGPTVQHVRRGGWFSDAEDGLRSAHRARGSATAEGVHLGFRCAKSVE